jgi:translation elongation factor EF-Ts
MEQKTAKVYLPTSYEQFLQQKKKAVKPPLYQKGSMMVPESLKESKPLTKKQTEISVVKDDSGDENEAPKKPSTIVEKIVHSDFKKMFDEFNHSRFNSIKEKING